MTDVVQGLRRCIHDFSSTFGLLSGYVELAIQRPERIAMLEEDLFAVRERWEKTRQEVARIYLLLKQLEDQTIKPVVLFEAVDIDWKKRAEEAEHMLNQIERQRDRWLTSSTTAAVAAGQTLNDILQSRKRTR